MSLNNKQMLPARVRSMRQMNDLLDAEDEILAQIEQIIEEAHKRHLLIHKVLVNEEWLEKNIQEITGGAVDVSKNKNSLAVEISINRGELTSINAEKVIAFLNKWLPAHLAYGIIYEKLLSAKTYHAVIWQNDEIMTLRQVII